MFVMNIMIHRALTSHNLSSLKLYLLPLASANIGRGITNHKSTPYFFMVGEIDNDLRLIPFVLTGRFDSFVLAENAVNFSQHNLSEFKKNQSKFVCHWPTLINIGSS